MDYKNNFRIQTHGDGFEKTGWNLFVKDKFPNYDVFWANFIAPNTRRPADIWFKDSADEEIRILSMLHYGIFQHFLFIYKNIGNANKNDVFNYSYVRLSSICDICEEFLFRVLLYTKQLDPLQLVEDSIKADLTIKKGRIKRAIENGQNYSLSLFKRIEILKSSYQSAHLNSFEKLSSDIRMYRNILIHSWPLFQIGNLVPKKIVVLNKEFRDWTKIINILKNSTEGNEYTQKNFIEMKEFLNTDTEKLITLINEMWHQVISLMNNFIYEN